MSQYTKVSAELKDLSRIFTYKAIARIVGSHDTTLRHNAHDWAANGIRNKQVAEKIKDVHKVAKERGWI